MRLTGRYGLLFLNHEQDAFAVWPEMRANQAAVSGFLLIMMVIALRPMGFPSSYRQRRIAGVKGWHVGYQR